MDDRIVRDVAEARIKAVQTPVVLVAPGSGVAGMRDMDFSTRARRRDTAGWIIKGLVAAAIVLGILGALYAALGQQPWMPVGGFLFAAVVRGWWGARPKKRDREAAAQWQRDRAYDAAMADWLIKQRRNAGK